MKPLWSVVVIARNEEKTLPRLLKSLEEFRARGGETIILDTGSQDKTAQVARDWGCRVEEVGDRFKIQITQELADKVNADKVVGEAPILETGQSLFDFTSARNYAASLATTDMISMPDCDESFTTLNINEINKAIENGAEQLEYNFVFSHDNQGRPLIKFLHSKFYNRTKLKWQGVVHEILSGEARRVFLPENIIYLEHYQNHETNRSGYLKGLALDCYLNPSNDRNSHYLGRELLWTKRPRSAIKELERHVAMNKWPAERSQSFVYMGQAYADLGEEDKAIECWHKAIQVDCSRREPFLKLADYYFKKDDAMRARIYATAALEIPQSSFYADNSEHYRHVPHELLYWACWWSGDREKAKIHFNEALRFAPLNSKFLHDARFFVTLPTVSFIIPHLGRDKGLERCLASIKALNYPQELIDVCVLDEVEPTVPQKVKQGVEKTKGEYLVYGANDVEFLPDSLIVAILTSLREKKRLVAFHSEELLPDNGNICAHFLIKRDLIPLIGGEIFDTEMIHCGVDNLLWAKCGKINEAIHDFDAKILHHHFSKQEAEYDWVYERGWKNADKDRELLKKKLKELL